MSGGVTTNDTGICVQQQYCAKLITLFEQQQGIRAWMQVGKLREEQTDWNSPENIETGISGILVFLIAYYRQYKEEKVFRVIEQAVQELTVFCKETPSNNFALFTGRGGVVYVMLQWYTITSAPQLLEDAATLLKPVSEEYFVNSYTTDYLYDGRAGTLLVLLLLHQYSNAAFIRTCIDAFLNKILAQAVPAENGCYWIAKEEIAIRPSCSFGYGTAGISYVLSLAARFMGEDSAIEWVRKEADRYTASCWDNDMQNWGSGRLDIRSNAQLQALKKAYLENDRTIFQPLDKWTWADGLAGILMSGTAAGDGHTEDAILHSIAQLLSDETNMPDGLGEGLAGLGMYCLCNKQKGNQFELNEIIQRVQARLQNIEETNVLAGGLFKGCLGNAYFLMLAEIDSNQKAGILLPGSDFSITEYKPLALQVDTNNLRSAYLTAQFPKSMMVIEYAVPHLIRLFHSSRTSLDYQNDIKLFPAFVTETCLGKVPMPLHNRLCDLMHLEVERLQFMAAEKRSILELYLSELTYLDWAMVILNEPDEVFFSRKMRVPANLKIVKTKWNWNLVNVMGKPENRVSEMTEVLNAPEGEYKIMFEISPKGQFAETELSPHWTIVLDRFGAQKSAEEVVQEVCFFIRSASAQQLQMILASLQYTLVLNASELVAMIEGMARNQVRQSLYRRMLELCP